MKRTSQTIAKIRPAKSGTGYAVSYGCDEIMCFNSAYDAEQYCYRNKIRLNWFDVEIMERYDRITQINPTKPFQAVIDMMAHNNPFEITRGEILEIIFDYIPRHGNFYPGTFTK